MAALPAEDILRDIFLLPLSVAYLLPGILALGIAVGLIIYLIRNELK
mgnify:CR=1